MIQNPGYVLRELADIPYLLPYGQMIADHRRGTKINHSGVYLWNLLEKDMTLEDVLEQAETYFEPAPQEKAVFHQEITQFLDTLLAHGILLQASNDTIHSNDSKYLTIAGLNLKFNNFHNCFPEQFNAFITEEKQTIHMNINFFIGMPANPENGRMILRNYELNVMELAEKYILTLPQNPEITEIQLWKDGTRTDIYSIPLISDEYREKLFHAIRLPFLYLAQMNGMAAIHSASILYKEKAWLFSAPSGTGKSTHAALWNTNLNTKNINGDLNLLAFENEVPVVHGIPWCGTSGIYDTASYSLGGITLLKQAPTDHVRELTEDEKPLMVSQRFISPSWDVDMFEKNMKLAEEISSRSLICRLYCTKENSAMEIMKQRIDKYLEDA